MKSCAICSTPLKFLNTPLLGSGKLNDCNELCTKCYSKTGATSVKKYSLADIHDILRSKETSQLDKKLQDENNKVVKAEKKTAEESERKVQREEKKVQEEEQKTLKVEQKKEEMKTYLQEKAAEDNQRKARLEEIKLTIQNLKLDNLSSFFGRKEINELPQILAANEQIDHIIQGIYNDGQGILVSTDRRLVFIDKGLLYGLKVEDFPLEKITSIQYETGLLFGKVRIHTSGNIANIEQVDKSAARKFSEFVRDKLSRPKEQLVHSVSPAQPSVLDQLEKLGQLKGMGILSDDEFTEQKKKLLEKL